jgi:putative transposase
VSRRRRLRTARGFVYLTAVIDWYSRRVLAWRVSITMTADFCVTASEEAPARHGKPEIFDTDQGSKFNGTAFTAVLHEAGIAIGMDGKGAWRDNVFVERLWRSVKYEEVYLRAYDTVFEAGASIGRYLTFYNETRPHSAHGRRTPDQAYFNPPRPNPGRGVTSAEIHLATDGKLSRQAGPPLPEAWRGASTAIPGAWQ